MMIFTPAHAQQVLHVSVITDEALPTELQRKLKSLSSYLDKKLGVQIEFTPVTDYAAAVEVLLNNKLDLVLFGGFIFVSANIRSGSKVIPIVQREENQKFCSVFITIDKSINTPAHLNGKDSAFGAESLTSGHFMPCSYLAAAKINPDVALECIAFSSAHDATAAAVAGGKVDAGVLDISVWEKLVAEGKVCSKVVRVLYTAQDYYDYSWGVRSDMNPELRASSRPSLKITRQSRSWRIAQGC